MTPWPCVIDDRVLLYFEDVVAGEPLAVELTVQNAQRRFPEQVPVLFADREDDWLITRECPCRQPHFLMRDGLQELHPGHLVLVLDLIPKESS